MKKLKVVIGILLFSICYSNAISQNKIGFVSPDEIFGIMPDTKKADSALAAFQKSLQENYKFQEEELNAALEKFVKDSVKLTSAEKEAKRTGLQNKITELQERQTNMNDVLEAEKEKQIKPIRGKNVGCNNECC